MWLPRTRCFASTVLRLCGSDGTSLAAKTRDLSQVSSQGSHIVNRPGMLPVHSCEVSRLFAVFFPDRNDRLRRRNVVSRTLVNFILRRSKALSEMLLRVRQSVSVAHQFIVADSEVIPANADS